MAKHGTPTQVRRHRILEISRRKTVSNQAQLARLLRAVGIRVAQSTLSRDIRELGLVKARGVYVAAPVAGKSTSGDRLRQSLRQFVLDRDVSGNMLVLKTEPGNGHPLGVALDSAQWPEVLGTVAGDDTVFVLLRSPRAGRSVLRRIEECLK